MRAKMKCLVMGLLVLLMLMGCKNDIPINQWHGKADVDVVQVSLLESFPAQALVKISGRLPTPCCFIVEDAIQTKKINRYFFILIPYWDSTWGTDSVCAQVLQPFSLDLPLNIAGLPAGKYTVVVNGIRDSFVLQTDNWIPDNP